MAEFLPDFLTEHAAHTYGLTAEQLRAGLSGVVKPPREPVRPTDLAAHHPQRIV